MLGGIGVGLAVGYLIRQLRRRLDNPPVEIAIALLSGYLGYLPAQALGVSGVLAAVTVGIYMGWHTPELTTVQTRLQGQAVWEIVFLLLNGLLFALVGLQLPSILDALSGRSTAQLHRLGRTRQRRRDRRANRVAARAPTCSPGSAARMRMDDPAPSWQAKAVVAWSGMRGAVSLAAALALPLTTDAGASFPDRQLIIFLTFGVIFTTLVLQGLTLSPLIRALDLDDGGVAEHEEAKARIRAAEAALERLDELSLEDWVREDTAERMRGLYGFRQERFRSRYDPDGDGSVEERSQNYQRLRRELLDAERMAVTDLRQQGVIGDDVMRRVVRDLDLEDARLDYEDAGRHAGAGPADRRARAAARRLGEGRARHGPTARASCRWTRSPPSRGRRSSSSSAGSARSTPPSSTACSGRAEAVRVRRVHLSDRGPAAAAGTHGEASARREAEARRVDARLPAPERATAALRPPRDRAQRAAALARPEVRPASPTPSATAGGGAASCG